MKTHASNEICICCDPEPKVLPLSTARIYFILEEYCPKFNGQNEIEELLERDCND
jgi:hypothetical protein